MRKSTSWLLTAGLFLLILAALLVLFEWAALNRSYHTKLHAEQNAIEATGLTQAGTARASDVILGYLRGEKIALTYTDSVYGETARVFGDDEVRHMEDVLTLFNAVRTLRAQAAVLGLFLALVGFVRTRRIGAIFRSIRSASLLLGAAIALSTLCAAFDFDRAFDLFHRALFRNDLWMMTESQLMIRLYPAEFFMALAGQIALVWGITLLVLIVVGIYGARWEKRTCNTK